MRAFLQRRLVQPLLALLRQGVTPRDLALSVALGITLGLVPILGISTALCALLALVLKLNMPAIQLVNYLMTPAQLVMIIPFLRLGERLTGAARFPITLESGLALLAQGVWHAIQVLGVAIVHAALGWIVVAPVVAFILIRVLEPLFRRLRLTSQGLEGAR